VGYSKNDAYDYKIENNRW